MLVSHERGEIYSEMTEYVFCRFYLHFHYGLDYSIDSKKKSILFTAVASFRDAIGIEDDDIFFLEEDLLLYHRFRRISNHTERDSARFYFVDFILLCFIDEEIFMSPSCVVEHFMWLIPAKHDTGHHHILFDTRFQDAVRLREDPSAALFRYYKC